VKEPNQTLEPTLDACPKICFLLIVNDHLRQRQEALNAMALPGIRDAPNGAFNDSRNSSACVQ
jgi:hypothetical protein